jgi:hypothetical protein
MASVVLLANILDRSGGVVSEQTNLVFNPGGIHKQMHLMKKCEMSREMVDQLHYSYIFTYSRIQPSREVERLLQSRGHNMGVHSELPAGCDNNNNSNSNSDAPCHAMPCRGAAGHDT